MTDSRQGPVLALLAAFDDLNADYGPGPRPRSPAALEADGYPRPLSVQTAYSIGLMALASARDHLEAVDLIVRFGQPSVAHWTSLRGLLEAASIASWLFDPAIVAHERVSRSLALRFTTLIQQRKIASAEGDTATIAAIDVRLDDIERIAASLGFAPIRNKNGVRDGIGQRKPQTTELAESEFDFRNLYRFLSSVAHCDSAVILELGFKKVADDADGQPVLQRDVSLGQLKLVLGNALMLYARPLWMQVTQYAFDRPRAAAALERAYSQLGLADTDLLRFWRQGLGVMNGS